jgi:hypothetical protein
MATDQQARLTVLQSLNVDEMTLVDIKSYRAEQKLPRFQNWNWSL